MSLTFYRQSKFSYIEFFVILMVILTIISLINPSILNLVQNARNTQCLAHLQKIHIGLQLYGEDSNGLLLPVRARRVQINIGASQMPGMPLAGIANQQDGKWTPNEHWNCPSRKFTSQQEGSHFVLAYQYFGGIKYWTNPWGRFESRSPTNLNFSKSTWVLAADTTAKIDGEWGAGRKTSYLNMPSHRVKDKVFPAGSNQVYVDGSAAWVDFIDLLLIHTWSNDGSRKFYMTQNDLGSFKPPKEAQAIRELEKLKQ